MKSVKEGIKFRIAGWLDKKYPDACWFNLVMWASGYRSFSETFMDKDFSTNSWNYQYCKIKEPNNCYCGKCEKQSSVKKEE